MPNIKIVKFALVAGLCAVGASVLRASGPLGIFAIVDKVVFEPTEAAAERIQVWGAFAYGDVGPVKPVSRAQRGYMYFAMPTGLTASGFTLVRLRR